MKPLLPIICIQNPESEVLSTKYKTLIWGTIYWSLFNKAIKYRGGIYLNHKQVHTESFLMYKVCIERNITDGYNDHCESDNWYACICNR